MLKKSLCVIALFCHVSTYSITLVYNIKIRQIFNINLQELGLGQKKKALWIASVVPVIYKRVRDIKQLSAQLHEDSLMGGALLNLRVIPSKHWWIEATTGIEKERVKMRGTLNFNNSRIGCDDIVLSAGRNFFFKHNVQCVVYGLAGFPTRTSLTPLEKYDTLVGTRFFGTGGGTELSYAPIHNPKQSLVGIVQTRFLHFFERGCSGAWFPGSRVKPGNVTDVLCAGHYRRNADIFEAGYNMTFFSNQELILPLAAIKNNTYLRNSMYVTYSHFYRTFPLLGSPVLLGVGFYMARSKRYDTKILSGWLNCTFLF